MSALTIALSKGRILEETLPLLEAAGLNPAEDVNTTRKLMVDGPDGVRFLIIRAADVATYVERGAADLGIVFLFAARYHPAFRHDGPVRREEVAVIRAFFQDEREQRIRQALDTAVRTIPNARWREDKALLNTVVNLTEMPSVLMGGFDPESEWAQGLAACIARAAAGETERFIEATSLDRTRYRRRFAAGQADPVLAPLLTLARLR